MAESTNTGVKIWVVILIAIALFAIGFMISYFMNQAKLKKAATAGKITIAKQDYSVVKVIASPMSKTVTNTVDNADGSKTVTYSDGTTSIIPKAVA